MRNGTNTSFDALKQIDASLLHVVYAEAGKSDGPTVVLAEGEPQHDKLEQRLATGPVITVPTMTLEGDANGAPHLDARTYAGKFAGSYAHRIIEGGVGHNLPQEAPGDFIQAIVDVDAYETSA
jgi:pimeloyl-ACP methyl ester carboxylesterase